MHPRTGVGSASDTYENQGAALTELGEITQDDLDAIDAAIVAAAERIGGDCSSIASDPGRHDMWHVGFTADEMGRLVRLVAARVWADNAMTRQAIERE